jgi:TolB-like protein
MLKKLTVFVFLVLFIFSCTITNKSNKNDFNVLSELDIAIINSAEDIIAKVPENTKIALFNISTNDSMLTNYVIEEISVFLVSRANFIVLERNNLEIIEAEHRFQLSGNVKDEDILSIAQKQGATSVVSCSITGEGDFLRLRVRTLEVETGKVQSLTSHILSEIIIRKNPMENSFAMVKDLFIRNEYTIIIPDFNDRDNPDRKYLLGYFIAEELRNYLSKNTSHKIFSALEDINVNIGYISDEMPIPITRHPDFLILGGIKRFNNVFIVNH